MASSNLVGWIALSAGAMFTGMRALENAGCWIEEKFGSRRKEFSSGIVFSSAEWLQTLRFLLE